MELEEAVQRCLNREARPYLHIHGGELSLVSVVDGMVTLRFEGACRGCPLRPVTLLSLIRKPLLRVPGVTNVQAVGLKITESTLRAFEAIAASEK
jgi:Fe-S cluster biogenesis protein NfuA